MKNAILIGLFSVFALAAQAQDNAADNRPTMFVAPLDGDKAAIMAWQPALGEGLAEMLITELSRIGKYQMVESTALKELASEIDLGKEGYINEQERVEKGGWAGADFMFRGKVTRFGSSQQKIGFGGFVPFSGGDAGIKTSTSDVRIDWRLVDVQSRKILKTGSATASQKGLGFDVGVAVQGHGGHIGYDNKEFMNSALGKATCKAVTNIVTDLTGFNPPQSGRARSKTQAAAKETAAVQAAVQAARETPGKVLAVAGKGTLIVSLGSKCGFKNGDKLKLYEAVEIKDDKGQVVFTEEKLVGEVVLDSVQEERSKATYSGQAEVKQGWIVKEK